MNPAAPVTRTFTGGCPLPMRAPDVHDVLAPQVEATVGAVRHAEDDDVGLGHDLLQRARGRSSGT